MPTDEAEINSSGANGGKVRIHRKGGFAMIQNMSKPVTILGTFLPNLILCCNYIWLLHPHDYQESAKTRKIAER